MWGHSPKELTWIAVAAGSAAIAGSVIHGVLRRGWEIAADDEPPAGPHVAHASWRRALLWAVATAGIAAAAEVAAQKAAASGWKKATGKGPPRI